MSFLQSFTGRLVLGAIGINILLVPLLLAGILFFIEKNYQSQFLQNARNTTRLIASQLSVENFQTEREEIELNLEELMRSGSVTFVAIITSEGETIRPKNDSLKDMAFKQDFFFSQHNDNTYFISVPIISSGSDQKGKLQLGFNESLILEEINIAYKRGIYLTLGYMLLSIVVIFIVAPQFTKSLRKLRDAARRITTGHYEETLKVKTNISEISSLAQDLEIMHQELLVAKKNSEQANQSKSLFLSNMSHEIRTPLTAIIGYSEACLDVDQSLQERQEAIKSIYHSGAHLLQLINDILDLSKIEAGRLETECILMSPFQTISEVELLLRKQAKEKQLKFIISYDFPLPIKINSDPVRLKQILLNLCSNAIKFTDSGHVKVAVKCNKQLKMITFEVIDSGIGLTDEQINRIFDAFTQADASTTRKYGGTGLGLSLSKRLAELLDGSLTVRSIRGVGSQFLVSISTGPLDSVKFVSDDNELPHEIDKILFQSNPYMLSGHILVAEDTLENQQLLKYQINKMGLTVTIVSNGEEAIEAVGKEDFDLLIMDMQMPVMDGMEAVAVLRKEGYNKPILAFTANVLEKDRLSCLEAGCNDFITKPVKKRRLFEAIAKYLEPNETTASDTAPIISNLLDDEPELIDLVQSYKKELPHQLDELKYAVSNANWTSVKSILHELKGTGGGMGYPMIYDLTAEMEIELENHQYDTIDSLIAKLENIIKKICATNDVLQAQ